MNGPRAWRRVGAVIALDLRLHGVGILGINAAAVMFILLANAIRPSPGGGLMALAFNMNLLFPMVWSDWLISREKITHTIGWIRSLPVSDASWLVAKTLTISIAIAVTWLSSAWAASAARSSSFSSNWWLMLGALLAQGGLAVAARVRFTQKTGQILPLVIVGVPLALYVVFRRRGLHPPSWLASALGDGRGWDAAVVASLAVSLATLWYVVRWLRRADTHALFE